MKNYALLIGDEDGNCFKKLKDGDVDDLVQVMEDYGFEGFIEEHKDKYPENWSDNEAVLIEYEVIVPKKVEVVTKYEI